MISIVWKINEMVCYPQSSEYEKVVHFVGWGCTAAIGLKTQTRYSEHILPSPTDSFTPYEQLTEDQVLSWLWESGVNKDAVESNLTETLSSMPDPVSVSLPLPWSRQHDFATTN